MEGPVENSEQTRSLSSMSGLGRQSGCVRIQRDVPVPPGLNRGVRQHPMADCAVMWPRRLNPLVVLYKALLCNSPTVSSSPQARSR